MTPVRKKAPDWLRTTNKVLNRPLRYVTFGEIIARKRKHYGMSQQEFATKVNISRNYVSMIERDQTPNLSVRILVSLAEVLGIQADALFRVYVAELQNENRDSSQMQRSPETWDV